MWQTLKRSFSPMKTSTGVSLYPDTLTLNQNSASNWFPPSSSTPVHLPWYSIVSGFPNNTTCIDVDHSLELLAVGTMSGQIIIMGATSRQRGWTLEPGISIQFLKFIQNRGALIVSSYHRIKKKQYIHVVWFQDSPTLQNASLPVEFTVSCINTESCLYSSCSRADFDVCLLGTNEGIIKFLVVNHTKQTTSLSSHSISPKNETFVEIPDDNNSKSVSTSETGSSQNTSYLQYSCAGKIVAISQIPTQPQFFIILQPKGAALVDLRVFLEQNKPPYTPIVWDFRSPLTKYTSECTSITVASSKKIFVGTDCGHILYASIPEITSEPCSNACLLSEKYFLSPEHEKHPITDIFWIPFSTPPLNLHLLSQKLKPDLDQAKDPSVILNLHDPDELAKIQTKYAKNVSASKWKKFFKESQKSIDNSTSMLIVVGGNPTSEPVHWSCIPELDFSIPDEEIEHLDESSNGDSSSPATGSASTADTSPGIGSNGPNSLIQNPRHSIRGPPRASSSISSTTPRYGSSSIDSKKPKVVRSRSRISFMPGKFSKSSISIGSLSSPIPGDASLGNGNGSNSDSNTKQTTTTNKPRSSDSNSDSVDIYKDSPPNLKSGFRSTLPLPLNSDFTCQIFWKSFIWPHSRVWPFSIFFLCKPSVKQNIQLNNSTRRISYTPGSPMGNSSRAKSMILTPTKPIVVHTGPTDPTTPKPAPPTNAHKTTSREARILCWNFVQTLAEMKTNTSPSQDTISSNSNRYVTSVAPPDFWPGSIGTISFLDSIHYFPDSEIFRYFSKRNLANAKTWPLDGGTYPTLSGPRALDWSTAYLFDPPKPTTTFSSPISPRTSDKPKTHLPPLKIPTSGSDDSETSKSPKSAIPEKDIAHFEKNHRDSVDNLLNLLKHSNDTAKNHLLHNDPKQQHSPISHISIVGTEMGKLYLINSDGSSFDQTLLVNILNYTLPLHPPSAAQKPSSDVAQTSSDSPPLPWWIRPPFNPKITSCSFCMKKSTNKMLAFCVAVGPRKKYPTIYLLRYKNDPNPGSNISNDSDTNTNNKPKSSTTPPPIFLSLPPKGKAKQHTLDFPIEHDQWYLSTIISIVLPDYNPFKPSPISALIVDSYLNSMIVTTTNGQIVISNPSKLLQFTLSEPITCATLSFTIPSSLHYNSGLLPTLFCGTKGGKIVIYANTDFKHESTIVTNTPRGNTTNKTNSGHETQKSPIAVPSVFSEWQTIHTLEPTSPSSILQMFVVDQDSKIPLFANTDFAQLVKTVPHRFLGVTSRNHFRIYHLPTFERISKTAFLNPIQFAFLVHTQNTSKRSSPINFPVSSTDSTSINKTIKIKKPLFCPLLFAFSRKLSFGVSLFDLKPFEAHQPPARKTSMLAPFNFEYLAMFLDGSFLAKFSGMWVQGSIVHANAGIMPHSPQPIFDLPVVLPNPPPIPNKHESKTNILKKTSTRFKSFFRRSMYPGSPGSTSTNYDSSNFDHTSASSSESSSEPESDTGYSGSSPTATNSTGSSGSTKSSDIASEYSDNMSGSQTQRNRETSSSSSSQVIDLVTRWKDALMLLDAKVSPQKLLLSTPPSVNAGTIADSAAVTSSDLAELHQKVLERQEKIANLVQNSEQLEQNAGEFRSEASELAKIMEKKSKWF